MSENGGSSQATVRRYTDTTNALVVNLSSNDLGKAIVPETVTIAAGEATSPSFVVKAVDDAMVGVTQKVIITASAEGHTDGSDTINVMEEMLIWDPPLQLQNLAGYKVYYGKASGSYDISIDVYNETSFPLDYLPIGESYYLAVTAYDITRNESAYSNEVEYTSDIFFH
ncbi:MAG: hypothetical protein GY941_06605, partial [Planctomycetes bacterium]|nr:hypothetical protein [Planctomycetota bacterium]